MGVSLSRYSDIAENEYVARFCSDEGIVPNDPIWNKLLSFNIVPPKNAEEQLIFDSSTEQMLYKFLENNLQTGNLGSLVRVFITRASELLAAQSSDSVMLAWQTFNALFVIRAVAKYLIETLPEYQVCQHFDVDVLALSKRKQSSDTTNQVNGVATPEKSQESTNNSNEATTSTSTDKQESGELCSERKQNGVEAKVEKPTPRLNANESNLEMLIDALVGLIIYIPVTDNTYYLHLECINTLLVLMSVYMFAHVHTQTRLLETSLIYRTLYRGRYSMHASALVKALLQNFSAMRLSPDHMFSSGGTRGSLVLGLASGIWSVLTLSAGSSNRRQSILASQPTDQSELLARLTQDHPVANQSCLLLLALTNHCCDDNLYRKALLCCVDIASDSTTATTQISSIDISTEITPPRIDMGALHRALCVTAGCEHSTLLLYLMLHSCKAYKRRVCSDADIENLMLPILRCLYAAPDSNSHHIYMALIIILILSEDDSLNSAIHQIMLKNLSWYTERAISEISLGGVTVLVILRTVQYNILRVRDKYLHTNCLAALANMSSEFRNLHPYVAQRLVSLYETLSKRKKKLEEKMEGNIEELRDVNGLDVSELNADEKHDALVSSIYVLDEVLQMLLEILNSCLWHQLSSNVNLVYALLYKKHVFADQQHHVAHNLEMVIGFFSSRLQRVQEGAGSDLSVSEVLATIRKGVEQWSNDRLKKLPALKFRYVEEERPEEFFTPYVWSLVGTCGNIYWASEAGARAHRDLAAC